MTDTDKYFDWAATSPADKDILQDSLNIYLDNWANASSSHSLGKRSRSVLEEARVRCASALGVKAECLTFTSGGTESDQIVLLSMLQKQKTGTVLISSIEHPAVREQAFAMKNCGWNVIQIPSDSRGIITPAAVEKCLTEDTMLVCVMAVNNETGAIQPIYEIADLLTKKYDGKRKPKFHTDCVQAAGKIVLNLSYEGIDSAAFSAHKICGPKGCGLLYSKNPITPFLKGGGQENGIRSGTENLMGCVAISKCLERYYNKENQNIKSISENFVKELSQMKGCTLVPAERISSPENYSPYVIQAAFENIPGNVMLRALDAQGFCISTGSACSAKKNSRPILEAMNVKPEIRENAVRFSFGPHTTKEAVENLTEAVRKINSQFNRN